MEQLLNKLVGEPELHCRWLNTLSMMENTGAKKIKRCEHPVFVSEIILKHAAEEARHAYYLKKQIRKIDNDACPTYEYKYLLAPKSSYAYLNQLDVDACRYLISNYGYKNEKLKYAAYLLVTYAIEVRADDLYPRYQKVLNEKVSPVNVRNIITEEEQHLFEMKKGLQAFSDDWEKMRDDICEIENNLFERWINELEKEVLG
jgi:hypothetical protein